MSKRAVMTEKPPVNQTVILGALWRTYKFQSRKHAEYMAMLERGQLPPPSLHQDLIAQRQELIYEKVKYVFQIDKSSPSSYELNCNGWTCSVEIHTLTDEGLLCILGGKKHVVYGQEFPSGLRLIIDGKTCLFHEEYDPTQLRSSMPGQQHIEQHSTQKATSKSMMQSKASARFSLRLLLLLSLVCLIFRQVGSFPDSRRFSREG